MYGKLEKITGQKWRLHFVRRFPHPPEKVWRAITEPEHLAAWFPTTIDGERKAGAKPTFAFPAGISFPPFVGTMLAYEPPGLMEFDWGGDIIRLEVEPDGSGSKLTLYDSLSEYGKAARDAGGWHVCLGNLERHIMDQTPEVLEWKPLFAEYGKRFGPEAASIGPPTGHPESSANR